ncbi:MAG: putative CRISPR-associated protein [Bacteroidia bacterium]
MKKIITTVGTSIFTNHFEELNSSDLQRYHEDLKGYAASRWNDEGIVQDRKELRDEVKKFWQSDQASAEISSLLKIAEAYKSEELEVYLIATDTVLSRLAAELVQEWFEGEMAIHFNPEENVISGLSIDQAGTFIEQGVQGLVQTILDIRGEDEIDSSMLLNISGGYKGLIPVMTIVGQLYDMSICYIYEDSEELIEIPRMPLSFDWDVMEQYAAQLLRPDRITSIESEALKSLHLINESNGAYTLTLLGTLIAQYLDRNPPFFWNPVWLLH